MRYNDVKVGRKAVAPEGERVSASISAASGSGSSLFSKVEEGLAVPMHNKRRRTHKWNLDPRVYTYFNLRCIIYLNI